MCSDAGANNLAMVLLSNNTTAGLTIGQTRGPGAFGGLALEY